jgi:hypothetical protein
MSIGNLKDPASKGSNYNWQLRMLQLAGKCCTPVITEAERISIADPAIGKMVYQADGTEGLYIYKSTGWTFIA